MAATSDVENDITRSAEPEAHPGIRDVPDWAPGPQARFAWGSVAAEAITVVVALAGAMVIAGAHGMSAGEGVATFAGIVGLQILPGAIVWRAVRSERGWFVEDLVAGFTVGSGFGILAQIVAGTWRLPFVSFALPWAFAILVLLFPARRRAVLSARWDPLPLWWTPAVLIGLVAFTRHIQAWYAQNKVSYETIGGPYIDAYLHQALTAQILHRGPTAWPTVQGEDLGYHWFTHAWAAHVCAVSGVSVNVFFTAINPVLVPVLLVLTLGIVAVRLTRSPFYGFLAVMLGCFVWFTNAFGQPTLVSGVRNLADARSPTLGTGAFPLLILLSVFAQRWRREAGNAILVLSPLLVMFATGSKGSTGPIVVAGLATAAVAMFLWNRTMLVPVLVDLAITTLCLGFVMVVVFHGSVAGLTFGFIEGANQTEISALAGKKLVGGLALFSVVYTILMGVAPAAVGFVGAFVRRQDPMLWVLVGGSLAAAGASSLFAHPGRSQYYFRITAIPVMALATACGIAALVAVLGRRRMAIMSAAALVLGGVAAFLPRALLGRIRGGHVDQAVQMFAVVVAVLVVVAVIGMVAGPRSRRLSAGAGLATLAVIGMCTWGAVQSARYPFGLPRETLPSLESGTATSQAQIDAARYIRDHSDIDDVVMTNRHCTVPREPRGGCDSRRWLVTAFSERQSFIEGWTATPKATELAPEGRASITVDYWHPDRLRMNDEFYTEPTSQWHRTLWEAGVRWMYADLVQGRTTEALTQYATKEFDNADAEVWKLKPPA